MRSSTLVFQAFSRLRCWIGDSAQSITTSSISWPAMRPDDLLDLALAEIGRGPDLADRRDQRLRDRQIDGARQADGFLEPRLGIAQDMLIRLRLGIAAAHSQIRADDDHPPGGFTPCRPRTVGTPFDISGFQSDHSQAGASSPPSNNWIGAPGMMVEIACLYTSCE